MKDSTIEYQHDTFYVQKIQVSNELVGVDRLELFRRLCQGKRVLHIGCFDYPLFNPHTNLHVQLEAYCAALDGFDVHLEAFERMRPFVKGKLFSKWEDICEEYDLVLVPEVLEHVPNVQDFLDRIGCIRTNQVIITVPDAFQCFRRHFQYTPETSTFVEVVHPDHNCWYTPYTLTNTLKKYTDWIIEGIWFVNGISIMASATVKQSNAGSIPLVSVVSGRIPKILLACDYYWPSNGGVETIAANLGTSLKYAGYEVEIATRSLPERIANAHRGMRIHSLDTATQMPDGFPIAAGQLQALIESGRYAAVIIMADPLTWLVWSLEGARVPDHTRVLVQPLINENGYASWRDNKPFRSRLKAALCQATDIVCLTCKGPDARFLESEHISFVNIPNATTPESVTTDFRCAYGFEEGRPLVIHVANLWRVKNQIGLIRSFGNTALNAQIALIGNPSGDQDYEHAVRSEVQKDPRFTILHGLHGEKIAAAMKAADLVVLPSLGEVFPVCLLEAMSHSKAWLATPQCGAANELAGGIIAPLDQFPAIVERLLANPDVLNHLGRLGRCHWEQCFQWPCVSQAWSNLIQKGTRPSSWEASQDVWEETLNFRRQVMSNHGASSPSNGPADNGRQVALSGRMGAGALDQEGRRETKSGGTIPESQAGSRERFVSLSHTMHPIRDGELDLPLVSVIVPTRDRPATLLQALKSILSQTYSAFEILVIDDGDTSVAADVMALNHGGRIRYVWNGQHRERSFSRNEGLQLARGKYVAYLDDDDIFYPDHLKTLVEALEETGCRVAYTDAYRAHQEQAPDGTYVTRRHDLPYSHDFDRDRILVSNFIPICCLMHERACLDSMGLFDESLATHEDWDLLIRLSRQDTPRHIKRVTAEFSWRMDGSTSTSSQQADFKRTRALIFERYAAETRKTPHILQLPRSILEQDSQSRPAASYDCSIIIPVWNKAELTQQCLETLAQATTNVTYEVVVVDNGSTDGTLEFLKRVGGDVRVVTNSDNLGFGKACNQGAAVAQGKYLVFLNNDTIPKDGWLRSLVQEVEANAEVGIVGSKLLFPDGTIQHAGVVRDCQHLLPYHIYKSFAGDHPAVNQRREFQIVTAACLLIRRALFEEVGGFDEGYVNGFEDADLCLKVRERGHRIVYQPRSVVTHLESQTPGRKTHEDANAARFLDRWGAQWWAADEDRHFYVDGYKLKRIFRNGQLGADIQLFSNIEDSAVWAHVAAAQAAATKQDWAQVRRELCLYQDWPADSSVLSWAARICEKLNEPGWQMSFLTRYLELEDDLPVRLRVIRRLLEQQDLAAADHQLQKLLIDCPTHAEGLLLKGILCMQREQYEQAEIAFGSAMREGADRKKCLMGRGMAAMGRAYTQGAWERFLEVLAENPDDAEAIHWLLRAGTAQNRWQELGEQLHRYVTRNPGDLAVRFALAGVLLRDERIEAAHREYDALQALAPDYDGLDQLGRAIAGKQAVLPTEATHS